MFFFHIQALVSGLYSCDFWYLGCSYSAQYNVFSLIFSWFALANIWLTFSIIIDLLPSQGLDPLGPAASHWFNLALKWIYLAFLALQFVLALGNRPKGEKGAYVATLWCVRSVASCDACSPSMQYRVYAFLALYLLVCSFALTIKAFAVRVFSLRLSPCR